MHLQDRAQPPGAASIGQVPRIPASPEAALAQAHRLAEAWAPGAARRDSERALPHDETAAFFAAGLGAITVPRAHGGPGLPFATLIEIFAILSAADSSAGQIPQNHFGVLRLLDEAGTPAQKQRFFAEVLAGRRIGNAGPEKGRKLVTHNTTALRHSPEGLRLSGRRFYSTGALFADWIPTRANDPEGRPVQVWVPRGAPGLRVIDDWNSFGQRTTASGTVEFDDVLIESETQVIAVWRRAEIPGLTGPLSQLIQAAIDAGIARQALAETRRFVQERARPWVDAKVGRAQDDPYIIADFGKLQIALWAAEELLQTAAALLDDLAKVPQISAEDSARASVAVAEAKVLTSEIALAASEKLFELAGSAAVRAGENLGRIWRNARVHTLHDPLRWKLHLLGNWHLNAALPARHQWN